MRTLWPNVLAVLPLVGCELDPGSDLERFRDVEACTAEGVEIWSVAGEELGEPPVYSGTEVVFNFEAGRPEGSLTLDTADALVSFAWHGLAVEGEIVADVSAELRLDGTGGACLALSEGELLFDDQECRRGRFRFSSSAIPGSCALGPIDDEVEGCFEAPVPETADCGD